ncbi:MAG: cysteine synthase A [Candidatus ainarchaeum sp.]|nr:cysteine synthase A [Candidatus ainarchaeum sp.]
MIYGSVVETIGRTPLVRLNRLGRETGAEILVKLERANPGGSIKDRIGLAMIEDAERRGLLKQGSVIVEATSGNTGIGLAMVAAAKGYKVVLTMPESMSAERRKVLKAYGAEIVLTPAAEGMQGAIKAAEALAAKDAKVFIPQQFENAANPEAHSRTTAREILGDTGGRIDAFVAGVGTGGTVTGVGRVLKAEVPRALVVAVEPAGSPVLSGGAPGGHAIQGIGAGFVPAVFDRKAVDRVIAVRDGDALATARALAEKEGMFVGISSGANVWAAIEVARGLGRGKRVVTVAPDGGDRYLSTGLCGE